MTHEVVEEAGWREYATRVDAVLNLYYEDRPGEIIQCIVEARYFNEASLFGRCNLHNANCEFLYSRIISCQDVNTKADIPDVYNYMLHLYENTPEYSYEIIIEKYQDILRTLLSIMEYSGHQAHQRALIIATICRKFSGDERIDARHTAHFVVKHRRTSFQAFKLIIGRLNKSLSASQKTSILKIATKLATQFETPNRYTQEALNYMTKRFAKA